MKQLLSHTIKQLLTLEYLLGWAYAGLVIYWLDLSKMEAFEVVKLLEVIMAPSCIIWFSSLIIKEVQAPLSDVLRQQPYHYFTVVWLKLAWAVFNLLLLKTALLVLLYHFGGQINLVPQLSSSLLTSSLLGLSACLATVLFLNEFSGYLIGFGYFTFEYFTRGKYTQSFHLFEYVVDLTLKPWPRLILVLVLLIILLSTIIVRRDGLINKWGLRHAPKEKQLNVYNRRNCKNYWHFER